MEYLLAPSLQATQEQILSCDERQEEKTPKDFSTLERIIFKFFFSYLSEVNGRSEKDCLVRMVKGKEEKNGVWRKVEGEKKCEGNLSYRMFM